MPSLIDIAREDRRQDIANDRKFWKNFVYFFELRAPTGGIAGTPSDTIESSIFPLVLNPQTITMSDPFTVTATPTLDGGLYVEENGIISRQLTITGQTGFAPRTGPKGAQYTQNSSFENTEGASFRYRGKNTPAMLSGQRHFQYLQDRVFRTYGDLKRNPNLAKDTKLFFHNPKDDEHWEVIPQSFTMNRDAARPLTYQYSIALLVVGTGEEDVEPLFPSEDTSIFNSMKDVVKTVRSAIDNANATLRDMPSEILAEIEQQVPALKGAVDLAGLVSTTIPALINGASAFVEGGASLIAAPFNTVTRITSQLDLALNNLAGSSFRGGDTVRQSLRGMQDAIHRFGVHPQTFQSDAQRQLADERRRQELTTSVSQTALLAAEAAPSTSLRQLDGLGTGLLAGDRGRARAETGLARNEPVTRSGKQYIVTQGDTLPRLAARFLKDKTRWRQIAVLNGLRAPYISEHQLPFTRRSGDEILIPSPEAPPSELVGAAGFGIGTEATQAERLLYTDLRLVQSDDAPQNFFDMEIDVEGGSTDFSLAAGIENLTQGIRTRLTTEQGTDVLYRGLGHKAVVGVGVQVVDEEMTEFRLVAAVQADPRIVGVRGVEFTQTQSDVIDVEMDAEVRGFGEQVPILVPLT